MALANQRTLQAAFAVLTLVHLDSFAQSKSGSVYVAPESGTQVPLSPDGVYCELGKLAFSIDKLPATPWPATQSVRIRNLDVEVRHRIVIMCGGQPQQSFTFSFSERKTTALCLFLEEHTERFNCRT